MKAETAVIALDLAGVAVSSGSACSSGKVQPSHVLAGDGRCAGAGAGRDPRQPGPTTTEADIDRCLKAWRKLSANHYLRGETIIAA